MQNKKSMSPVIVLGILAVVVFAVIVGAISLVQNIGKDSGEISAESAISTLDRLYNRVKPGEITPVKGNLDLGAAKVEDTLPDIEKYPPQVDETTDDFIEIFSSPEKATAADSESKTDVWLIEVAEKFNNSGATVNGKPVSVRVRGIASGQGMDYIASKKYTPDAFSPSNELWGDMLKAKGIEAELVEKKLAGNVAGMLFSKDKYSELVEKYGSVNLKTVTEAVKENEIAMGYTNPFASSSGLNFLVSTLYTFDGSDPLSTEAVGEFESFQTNIPFVAYTTLQMREAAKSGALDGFILEYQSYVNMPDIKSDYEFIPYGIRHDNPVYAIGNLSDTKQEILQQFVDFCKQDDNQQLASSYGFNNLDDYKYEMGDISDGDIITAAQKLWKEKKNGSNEVVAVFVADVSGSMEDNDALGELKTSLLQGAKYISEDNSIGLVTFSDVVDIYLPIGKFDTNQRAYFTGAVESMYATGATAMFDGIIVGAKMLMDEKENNPNAKLMLFVLTDGETNTGHSLKDVRNILATLKIPVYTIGYNADIAALETVSSINEAASINADTDDVVYKLANLFNAQM